MRRGWMLVLFVVLYTAGCGQSVSVPWATGDDDDDSTGWWNDEWSYRVALTVPSTAVDDVVAGAPVLVTLTPSRFDYATARPSGDDLRFIDPAGTELAHEVDTWNGGGESRIWVRWPDLDPGGSDVTVEMYFGNPAAAASQDPSTVWQGHQGVWHFSSGRNLDDSSGSGHGLQEVAGTVAAGDTWIGSTAGFDPANEARYAVASRFDMSEVTVSLWVRSANTGERRLVVDDDDGRWVLTFEDPDGIIVFSNSDDVNDNQATEVGYADGQWHHVAAYSDLADPSSIEIYIDGAAAPVSLHADEGWGIFSGQPHIGGTDISDNDPKVIDGDVDEARVFAGRLSPARMALDYASARDTVIQYGSIQTHP